MKKDNRGFMLSEVVVVSAILIGTMVSLYAGFNKVYKDYNERSKYYSIDCLYAGENVKNILIDEFKLTDMLTTVNSTKYIDIIAYCNNNTNSLPFNNYCQKIISLYNIDLLFLIKYDINSVNSLITNPSFINNNYALERYMKALVKGITTDDSYYIIVKDKNDYFASLEVIQ